MCCGEKSLVRTSKQMIFRRYQQFDLLKNNYYYGSSEPVTDEEDERTCLKIMIHN